MTAATVEYLHKTTPEAVVSHSHVGRVLRCVDGSMIVGIGAGEFEAACAASCLLQPKEGDEVLVATTTDHRRYVLAILEKADATSSELELQGDVTIRAKSGRLCLATTEALDMVSPKEISMTTDRFGLRAASASVFTSGLTYVGDWISSDVHKMKSKIGALDLIADRMSQRLKRSYRIIEDLEHVRAGQLDISAKKNLRMHAKNALITALSLVKVDGEQIHMG